MHEIVHFHLNDSIPMTQFNNKTPRLTIANLFYIQTILTSIQIVDIFTILALK